MDIPILIFACTFLGALREVIARAPLKGFFTRVAERRETIEGLDEGATWAVGPSSLGI